jgi:hypothetical protein
VEKRERESCGGKQIKRESLDLAVGTSH